MLTILNELLYQTEPVAPAVFLTGMELKSFRDCLQHPSESAVPNIVIWGCGIVQTPCGRLHSQADNARGLILLQEHSYRSPELHRH